MTPPDSLKQRPDLARFSGLGFLVLALVLGFSCNARKPEPGEKPGEKQLSLLDQERQKLGVKDMPSSGCQGCHMDKHQSWSKSLHAQAILDARKDPPKGDFSKTYLCSPEDAALVIRGRHKERYVVKNAKGELAMQLNPCEFDFKTKCMALGELVGEPPNWIKHCAGCHLTRLDHKTAKRLEDGVGCVACHGPYSWHDAKKMANFKQGSTAETPKQRVEICGQCHIQGGWSLDGQRRYPDNYLPFQKDLTASYKVPLDHLAEKGATDPSKLQSYDHIPFVFQQVQAGNTQTTCVDCHTLHPEDGGPPNWKKHSSLPEQPVCKSCHVYPTREDGRRPALIYNPNCPVCSAKGSCPQ